jgi:hypothetical protein
VCSFGKLLLRRHAQINYPRDVICWMNGGIITRRSIPIDEGMAKLNMRREPFHGEWN